MSREEQEFAEALPAGWPPQIARALAIIAGEMGAVELNGRPRYQGDFLVQFRANVDDALVALVGETCREPA